MPERGPPRARAGRAAARAALLALAALVAAPARGRDLPGPGGSRLEPVAFADLPGWADDDLAAALRAFRAGCAHRADDPPAPQAYDLRPACAVAAAIPLEGARALFEGAFRPYRVVTATARTGFLTGYFEPELSGSPVPAPGFAAPALARPPDLVSLAPGEVLPGLPAGLRAARRGASGDAVPYPDRAAIEDGALGPAARPLLYLRDAVDLLVLQVQGSGRVRLPDGTVVRLAYDGRNGRPYTAVARLIVEAGHLPLEGLTLERWTGWLRAHPEEARDLIRRNASYVFFKLAPLADPAEGPMGAAGVPLTPGRSLAVDAGLWPYGLPVFLSGTVAGADGAPLPLARLTVAGDTGSAIVGPARGDLFLGAGTVAGASAAALRHPVSFIVLLPREAAATAP